VSCLVDELRPGFKMGVSENRASFMFPLNAESIRYPKPSVCSVLLTSETCLCGVAMLLLQSCRHTAESGRPTRPSICRASGAGQAGRPRFDSSLPNNSLKMCNTEQTEGFE
jgi:hypothetical protein